MRYFFVDTENVSDYSFIQDMGISSNDTVVLFMSEKAGRVKLEDIKYLHMSNANIIYEDIYTGESNALDFQLIAFLSLTLCNSNNITEYIIVSNDNDYELPIKYLAKKTNENIKLLKTKTLELDEDIKIHIKNNVLTDLEHICTGVNFDEEILEMIDNSNALNILHNKLRNKFGCEDGREIYIKIKPYLKPLYKNI